MPTPYITQADLEARLSRASVLRAFDDGTGNLEASALALILQEASDLVDSKVSRGYGGPWPASPDPLTGAVAKMVRSAALNYAVAMTLDRHPELLRQFGEVDRATSLRKLADQFCEDLATGARLLVESTPAPTTTLRGGIVMGSGPRMTIDNADGTNNGGDFG